MNSKKQARKKVRLSIRNKVFGTSEIPRLAVYRSNKQIYAQIIDDTVGKTLTAASSNQKKTQPKTVEKEEKHKTKNYCLS